MFYGHWEGYCTARSYVWVEKYDTREAPNRQVRRAIEQENKKERDRARKERSEEVRVRKSGRERGAAAAALYRGGASMVTRV